MTLKERWKQFRCKHYETEVRAFIERQPTPLLRRESTCLHCGKKTGVMPPMEPAMVMKLLNDAARLPVGASVRV